MFRKPWSSKVILTISALVAVTSSYAAVDTHRLQVANNGVDSLDCGGSAGPCRTIGQAIRNAARGDVILVGPGEYGDVDGDGVLSSPGDEQGGSLAGNLCLICVDKTLTIISTNGASVTHIDAKTLGNPGSSLQSYSAVFVSESNVVFGRVGQGFTIQGAGQAGLRQAFGSGFKMAGNIAAGNGVGFDVRSVGLNINHNLALHNAAAGFFIFVPVANGIVRNNVAQGNGDGFLISGRYVQVLENVSLGNVNGIQLNGAPPPVPAAAPILERNSVFGNAEAGIVVRAGIPAVLRNNNVYGNGMASFTSNRNCGLLNESGLTLAAVRNYWGARTGPGEDPADNVCNFGSSKATTVPFLTVAASIPIVPFVN